MTGFINGVKNREGDIFMVKCRIAVATDGKNGLEGTVSNVFGRAKTFTIIETHDEKVISVNILDNPALSYSHGAGPIAIKTLIDEKVKLVIANELGVGASEILQQHDVLYLKAEQGDNVGKVIKKAIAYYTKELSQSS